MNKMMLLMRRIAWRAGYDIIPSHFSGSLRNHTLLNRYDINVIIDVGANKGQYGESLREMGYRGKIISFEPLSAAYSVLQQKAASDPDWQAVQAAIGDKDETATINIAQSSHLSSFLAPTNVFKGRFRKGSQYVGTEQVQVMKLDTILSDYCTTGDRVFLKIDTQGFEQQVLAGAKQSLADRILGVNLELSLVECYEGEMLMQDMIRYLDELGFQLVSLDPVAQDPRTSHLLQVDGTLFRRGSIVDNPQ